MNCFVRCLILFLSLLMISCSTTYPKFRSNVSYRYSQAPLKQGSDKLTKESITIEDKGASAKVIKPISVQKCNGSSLVYSSKTKYRTSQSGKKTAYTVKEPVYENVDPLENIYLRRIKIHNATEHVLHLAQIDVVFVDPSGNDYEIISKERIAESILSNRPCTTSWKVVQTLKPLKLMGGGKAKIRPGRNQEFLVAFPNLKMNIPGEWRLQLFDVPTKTDRAGNTKRKTSFEFPIEVTKYKTTVDQRKDSFLKGWKEIARKEEVVSIK